MSKLEALSHVLFGVSHPLDQVFLRTFRYYASFGCYLFDLVFSDLVQCIYGLLLGAWPIIIANAITLTLAISILVMKLRFR